MINKQITQKLNTIFKNRQDKAYNDQNARFKAAVLDPNFAQLYKEKRYLESEVARCKAMKLDYSQLEEDLGYAKVKYNAYVKAHNIDLSYHYNCDLCKDTGYVDGHECSCLIKERTSILKEACALSPMPNFTFKDNIINKLNVPQSSELDKLFKVMNKYCDNIKTAKLDTIYIGGEVGVGKTFLASCIANKLLDNGIDVNYVTAFDFFRIIQAKQFGGDKDLSEFYSTLFNCKMLIIDDIGAEPLYKNLSLEYMLSIIDYRTAHNLKTILISNLNPMQFTARYGERISSRINDPTRSFSIYIKGSDLRKIK